MTNDKLEQLDNCPWCNGTVRIQVCDDEGNSHDEEYENNPWSGLSYSLVHDITDVPGGKTCPIATEEQRYLGNWLYDSREEATKIWNKLQRK